MTTTTELEPAPAPGLADVLRTAREWAHGLSDCALANELGRIADLANALDRTVLEEACDRLLEPYGLTP